MIIKKVVYRFLLGTMIVLMVGMIGFVGKAETLYQTNINEYEPRIDLRTGGVMLHQHGESFSVMEEVISSWKYTNQDLKFMWFVGSDAGTNYVDGNVDGKEHSDEIETGRQGDQFWIGDSRPYMVPTAGWTEYMKELAFFGIDQGVQGLTPEEPLMHTGSGYSPAFKQEWDNFYGSQWENPQSSVDAFWKTSKLKSELYYKLVKTLAEESRKKAEAQNQELDFILPVHSIVSYAAGNMIYPSGRTFHLEDLDGFIGQVWTGPVGWSLPYYEGNKLNRNTGFFESAWTLYSSFANLVRDSETQMYFLADPVEDDPDYEWDEYHIWYNQSLVTKLFFPWVSDYEVMPWPDRIFLPGYSTGGGSPGPADYLTQLMVNVAALSDMPDQKEINWQSGTQDIGVLIGDTLGWQRGGPEGSSMKSFHGLIVPLLRRGIPAQVVPIERVVDEGYLDEYDVLLVSYEMWKPLEPKHQQQLADWIAEGGTLVYFEADDPYNQVDEWWRDQGYLAPVEHLFSLMDLDIELKLENAGQLEDRKPPVQTENDTDSKSDKLAQQGWSDLVSGADKPLQPILEELLEPVEEEIDWGLDLPRIVPANFVSGKEEKKTGFVKSFGQGNFLYLGFPATIFADVNESASVLRDIVQYSVEDLNGGQYKEKDHLLLERGDYVIARGIKGGPTLEGKYIDLLDHQLPLKEEVTVKKDDNVLLYDVAEKMNRKEPEILYGSHEVIEQKNEENRTMIVSAGPWQTRGAIRLFAGTKNSGKGPREVKAFVLADTDYKNYDNVYDTSESWLKKMSNEEFVKIWPRFEEQKLDFNTLFEQREKLRTADVSWSWEEDEKSLFLDFEQWHSGVLLVVEW
ncbi:MAG: hypothetical protein ACOC2G_02635 [Bacillota bacterium]